MNIHPSQERGGEIPCKPKEKAFLTALQLGLQSAPKHDPDLAL